MASTPYFSVIIPTYNRDKFLPFAIQDMLRQTFADWELIVVDDGSTDNTKAVVENFQTDPRVRYHWQPNQELNAARNAGIFLARGRYLLFLDDDDSFENNHLQVLHSALATREDSIPLIRTGMWVKQGKQRQASSFLDLQQYHPVQQLWLRPTNLLSFAFHRSIFELHHFAEDLVLGDDFHFLIKVLLDFPLVQLEEFTVIYFQHPQNRTRRYFSPEKAASKFAALEALEIECGERLKAHIPNSWIKKWKGEQHLHFARTAFRAQAVSWGWRYLRQALPFFPQLRPYEIVKTFGMGLLAPFAGRRNA
ncbi:MAG: glycosyltransferase family 2 protein [Bacteroidota bacterium]